MPSPAGLRPAAVRPRRLPELAGLLGVEPRTGSHADPRDRGADDVAVSGITHDSRQVRPGDLYAALPGARFHGAAFVPEALAAGAAAVLTDPQGAQRGAERGWPGVPLLVVPDPRARLGDLAALIYGSPADALTTIGITGTNGKTTITYLAEAGLRADGRTTGIIGTIETRIGTSAGFERMPSARTTPEATDLQALLAVMRERGVQAAVMEVSSHALALGRVDGFAFDVAAFTNLSPDHLDFHRDLEDYFAAKAALFTPRHARCGVVNVDDAYGARLAASAPIPIVTVSPSGRADAHWVGAAAELGSAGSTFVLRGPDGAELPGSVRLPGAFNVDNAAVALVALVTAGVEPGRATAGVAACPGVPGRMERVEAGQQFLAVVDYAHSPEAVDAALRSLRSATRGRLLLVLGAGGDRDRHKRPRMGEVGARGADVLLVSDDNPRSEDPAAIRAAVLAGAREVPAGERGEVVEIADRRAAIEAAVRRAAAGDTVLVAGKGHEQGQDVGGTVHPFDDRVVLRETLARASRSAAGVADAGPVAQVPE